MAPAVSVELVSGERSEHGLLHSKASTRFQKNIIKGLLDHNETLQENVILVTNKFITKSPVFRH